MSEKAAITVLGDRAEVERLWRDPSHRPSHADRAESVRFIEAPGDHGTEIHVEVKRSAPGGPVGEAIQKVTGSDPLAQIKDELRHFKQLVETGVIARSDGVPEGESVKRKLRQRPAQPLSAEERQEVGV